MNKVPVPLLKSLGLIAVCTCLIPLIPEIVYAQWPSLIDLSQSAADVTVLGGGDRLKLGDALTSGDINGDGHEDWVLFSDAAFPLGRERVGMIDVLWGGARSRV